MEHVNREYVAMWLWSEHVNREYVVVVVITLLNLGTSTIFGGMGLTVELRSLHFGEPSPSQTSLG